MRLLPRSLHARMAALSAVAIAGALLLAGWTIAGVLERFVVAGLDRRLDAQIALLASSVDTDGTVDRARLRQRLGALEADRGWTWRIVTPDSMIGSTDFPALDQTPDPDERRHHPDRDIEEPRPREGADRADRAVHARQLDLPTSRGTVSLIAAAPRDVIRRPIRDALTPLLVVLGVLGALLGTATIVQLRIGLRPLRRLRDQTAAIRNGVRDRVDEDVPSELRALAVELNALAADNRAALATSRRSAANLAHALKTPVAALALDLRHDPARAAQVNRIEATLRHHLARARTEAVDRRAATALAPAVAGLVVAIRHLHAARGLAIDAEVTAGVTVAVDGHDLDEMIGNLIDNAAKHARSTVTLDARLDPADPRRAIVTVADDGPGIPGAERERATQPGVRLDETAAGDGFGLSIVSQLVALYGGTLSLDEAPGGGLRAAIVLPVNLDTPRASA